MKYLDLSKQYKALKRPLKKALDRVLKSQEFILGKEVGRFEKNLGYYLGVSNVVSVNSGTDALLLSLKALNIGQGDEVITTPFTFIATAEVIVAVGAKPVFVDIDPDTLNIDPQKIEKTITKKTKAIIPVHLFGNPAEMDEILRIAKKHHLSVIEDACQAIGAEYRGKKVGAFGICGCFSFFPAKNLGCFGDGGAIATNDPRIAEKLRLLRNHGSSPTNKYLNLILGTNSRLDSIQAAILNTKLPYLDAWNQKRRKLAERYNKALRGISNIRLPKEAPHGKSVFNQYTIHTNQRDALSEFLKTQNIPTMVYYRTPLDRQPVFMSLDCREGHFLMSESASGKVLSLPIYPEFTAKDQNIVIKKIKQFFDEKR